jgi:hypothetical protein
VGTSGSCIVLENVLFNTVSSLVLIVHWLWLIKEMNSCFDRKQKRVLSSLCSGNSLYGLLLLLLLLV